MNPTMKLFRYHQWANQKYFQHLQELPENVLDKKVESVFSSIREVLVHMIIVDSAWLFGIKGMELETFVQSRDERIKKLTNMSLEELEAAYSEVMEDYEHFLKPINDPHAPHTVSHPYFGSLETSYAELYQHIVNHGTYHRGNMTAMLRQMGHPGPSTDFIFYLYEVNK
ncbi:MAG TPA: DinB family protein [Bacillus sp. (in: firmicutes)]|uniref:DinB family protein n=1 Tax=Bacillus litorisediminis TaxID=2922713 RepID=UPI001FAD1188|nr:DinB family protein [Bacillus litorisediminis]HWO76582.1 DinB family protein [Bacillus sp. (in: firmicutes)]